MPHSTMCVCARAHLYVSLCFSVAVVCKCSLRLCFTMCQSISVWQCVPACLCSYYCILGILHEHAYIFWFWFKELLTESILFSTKTLITAEMLNTIDSV